jgi:hypothetical protein
LSSRVRKDDWSCVWISVGSVGIFVVVVDVCVEDWVVRLDIAGG